MTNHFRSISLCKPLLTAVALALFTVVGGPKPPANGATAVDLSTAIAAVAKNTIPAVAHIEVTQHQEVTNPFVPFENDPFFRYFFETPRMPHKFKRELKGLGSGMIIDSQGHILTNNHVVAGAAEVDVLLADGNQFKARIVGTDPKTDLAVIKIPPQSGLPHVTFGDSDRMEVGDWVVAIGHPRGLDQTVTQGIISAKHRTGITDPSSYQDFLQTDAAINPGNSGGPLLNLQGEVIGVNAAIASESGGFEGIGFAIPSNMARHIAMTLIEHGKVERGWLGVSIRDLTPELAKSEGLTPTKGAFIADVVKGGPAATAGIQKGDVVKAVDGKPVADSSALRNAVAAMAAGSEAAVTVQRKGETREIRVRISGQEDALKLMAASMEERLGAKVRAVSTKEMQRYGLEEGQGVAVESLQSGGLLAEAGLEKDDIILAVGDQAVEGVEGFTNLISSLPPHQRVVLRALDHRSGRTGTVEITLQ
jgi:serine protease Do